MNKKVLFLGMAIAVMSTVTVSAVAEEREVRWTCPEGEKVHKYSCEPGDWFRLTLTCSNNTSTPYAHQCTADEPKTQHAGKIGDWGLGLQGSWSGSSDVSLWSLEAVFNGHLRMNYDWLYWKFSVGPGVGWIDGEAHVVLTEFAGVQFRPKDWLFIDVGARHRVAFEVENGDAFNALMLEVGLNFLISKHWDISLTGGIGSIWYVEETVETGIFPAGYVPETYREIKKDVGGQVIFGVSYKF